MVGVEDPQVPAAPDGDGSASAHGRRPRRRIHRLAVVVLAVGLAVTIGLVVGIAVSIRNGDDRYLANQVRQINSALQASVPAIQQPLVAGARIAATLGAGPFRSYEAAEVGPDSLFRSVSLWRVTPAGLRLQTYVGARPDLLRGNPAALRALVRLRPSEQLGVIGVVMGRDRSLGFAQRLPGGNRNLVVYAEDLLPAGTQAFGPGSPFAGLAFELYQGRTVTPANLIERTVTPPLPGSQRVATVPYGTSLVTIVAVLAQRPPGVLPTGALWLVGVGALLLTVVSTGTAERLTRRRETAELVADDAIQRYDELKGISETLQHSLLPPETPALPGLELAGTYVAGVRQLGVGGDWYDAIPLDDDHVFLSVGDVAGKGHAAAQVMSSLRHAIRAYAVQGDAPTAVLAKLNDLVDVDRDDCFATVCCALLDVPARSLELASAGHLPPLLVDVGGARYVELEVGIPAGLTSGAPHPHPPTRLVLTPGSLMVFFTDGLVERRGLAIDDGLEALRLAAARADGDVGAVASSIVEAVVPDGGDDDLALLVVRWPEPVVAAPRDRSAAPASPRSGAPRSVARRAFPCRADSVELARRFVREQLGDPGTQQDVAALLVSELASNAVLHGRSAFEVAVAPLEGGVRVTVLETEVGASPPSSARPDEADGHGLQIVASLSARWGVESTSGDGTSVWFELPADAAVPVGGVRQGEE